MDKKIKIFKGTQVIGIIISVIGLVASVFASYFIFAVEMFFSIDGGLNASEIIGAFCVILLVNLLYFIPQIITIVSCKLFVKKNFKVSNEELPREISGFVNKSMYSSKCLMEIWAFLFIVMLFFFCVFNL
ncbi:MAG: hypothetical protein ACI4IH_06715 [Eubacterium sp.]